MKYLFILIFLFIFYIFLFHKLFYLFNLAFSPIKNIDCNIYVPQEYIFFCRQGKKGNFQFFHQYLYLARIR